MTTEPVLVEVLAGARTDASAGDLRRLLLRAGLLHFRCGHRRRRGNANLAPLPQLSSCAARDDQLCDSTVRWCRPIGWPRSHSSTALRSRLPHNAGVRRSQGCCRMCARHPDTCAAPTGSGVSAQPARGHRFGAPGRRGHDTRVAGSAKHLTRNSLPVKLVRVEPVLVVRDPWGDLRGAT
jgi:hypothetical protein